MIMVYNPGRPGYYSRQCIYVHALAGAILIFDQDIRNRTKFPKPKLLIRVLGEVVKPLSLPQPNGSTRGWVAPNQTG